MTLGMSSFEGGRSPAFSTTRWSVVVRAGSSDTPDARDALARLCQTYWYPLYTYVRRRGHSPEDAQDFTQEFLARLLEKNWVGSADKARGRFRTFLLSAMKHFLADDMERACGWLILSLFTLASAYIPWGMLHYSCWKALPERYRATTPGRAVGFMFIPLFNLFSTIKALHSTRT